MTRAHISARSALISCARALSISIAIGMGVGGAAEVTFVLRVENGRVPANMRLIRVKQNDVVRLRWSTDKPLTVHLHGYDIEQKIAPGAVSEMTFTARATGRFTIAPHLAGSSGGGHAHGDVLVTIEVYP
jgi:hypothetical protein